MDKKNNKRTTSRRIALIVYLIFLHVVAIFLLFILWDTKGTITSAQAKNLAYGFALKECYAQHDPNIDCSTIETDHPRTFCFDWLCTDMPLWVVDYKTIKGKTSFTGTINLDKSGRYQSPADMQKNFGAKFVVPDN